jgi:hypothetical protein
MSGCRELRKNSNDNAASELRGNAFVVEINVVKTKFF